METNKIILPTGNEVKGDITSCKIENQLIKTQRNSVWSIQELNTYASYNVCSKEIINQYVVPEMTSTSFTHGIIVVMGILIISTFMAAVINS